MQPIFITVGAKVPLMVIPDSRAHLNGHPVLTYTYSLYRDKHQHDSEQAENKESELHLEKKNDPDYLGQITFELPDKLFTYTADGFEELTTDEVEEAIEQITQYRDKSEMWEI